MKKLVILAAACLLPALIHAQVNYHVRGSIPSTHKATRAIMAFPNDQGKYSADTVNIVNGKFEFKGTADRPQLSELNLLVPRVKGEKREPAEEGGDNMKNVALFYSEGDINIAFDAAGKSLVTGGAAEQKTWQDYYAAASEKMKTYKGADFFEVVISDFVKSHPDQYVSIDLMEMFAGTPKAFEPMYAALSTRMQQHVKVAGWKKKIDILKKETSGTMDAPVFTMNDTNGKPVSLSSYKGSYVLVDFWASWCVPCRAENPNVVAAYEKYKDKKFQVLGVSLDTKKDAWIKAVAEDKLPWKQVCDFKAEQSEVSKMYNISSIPANVLVDPNGKIVGKNLRAEDLHEKLAEIFK